MGGLYLLRFEIPPVIQDNHVRRLGIVEITKNKIKQSS